MTGRRKLIEVALPLEAINEGSKPETENPFLKGHPRAIHNWWARTPLSVCRSVLFAQLVDDPGEGLEAEQAEEAREALVDLVRRLGTWEATTRASVIDEARDIINRQYDGEPPAIWDMFAGRGSISIEAQRLGLRVYSSDLNPVAVTIQKALLEYPQRFANLAPVNPMAQAAFASGAAWNGSGADGLVEDVRHYGRWIRDEAERRIGHLYPKARLSDGSEARVIAWLWARTVVSPNPAANGAHVPLVTSFMLSSKKGKEKIVVPVVEHGRYRFTVKSSDLYPAELSRAKVGLKVTRATFNCLISQALNSKAPPIPNDHVKMEGMAGRMGTRLMAVVAESKRGRVYLDPTEEIEKVAQMAEPTWLPEQRLPKNPRWFSPPDYGMPKYADLFTDRQLVALATYSDLISEARERVNRDYLSAASKSDFQNCSDGSVSKLYADAIATYLSCALSRMTDYHCSLSTWNPTNENVRNLFQRQAIPMVGDFAEANPLNGKLDFATAARWVSESLQAVPSKREPARVFQHDARSDSPPIGERVSVSTDPPYYDNIGYADLSDFFYVWLRRSLREIDPQTFRTVLTPKSAELIASPYRHDGSAGAAESHFRKGFASAFRSLHGVMEPTIPMTVYYAFKQSETEVDIGGGGATSSTGWETMLEGLISAGFAITGTWPVRTTKKARSVARNTNALASAIIIVCRERDSESQTVSRREFTNALKQELPGAVRTLQRTNIAPVDLAQAAIGPGMAVFSRYAQVLEADGAAMPVRQALVEINRVLDETLAEAEGDMDADTRFCVAWFEQYGTAERAYGEAEVLFIAKNTSFDGLMQAGVLAGGGGKVRLKRRDELDSGWDPTTDKRIADWECVQHLVRAMTAETGGGVAEAARLAAAMGPGRAENARALAYRLYTVSERRGWSGEALAYNVLVTSWPQIQSEMARRATGTAQTEMDI